MTDPTYIADCLDGCAAKVRKVLGTTYTAVAAAELREVEQTLHHYATELRSLGGGDQIPPPVDELESTPPGSVLPSSLPTDIDFDHEWLREFAIEADLDERRLG